MTWHTTHVLAWCPVCVGSQHCRAEDPSAADRARVRRWARSHAARHGHDVHMEEGRIDIVEPPTATLNEKENRT